MGLAGVSLFMVIYSSDSCETDYHRMREREWNRGRGQGREFHSFDTAGPWWDPPIFGSHISASCLSQGCFRRQFIKKRRQAITMLAAITPLFPGRMEVNRKVPTGLTPVHQSPLPFNPLPSCFEPLPHSHHEYAKCCSLGRADADMQKHLLQSGMRGNRAASVMTQT